MVEKIKLIMVILLCAACFCLLPCILNAEIDPEIIKNRLYLSAGFGLDDTRSNTYIHIGADAHLPLNDWLFIIPEVYYLQGEFSIGEYYHTLSGKNIESGITANTYLGQSKNWQWRDEPAYYFIGVGFMAVFDLDPAFEETSLRFKIHSGFMKGKIKITGFLNVPFERFYEETIFYGLLFSFRLL